MADKKKNDMVDNTLKKEDFPKRLYSRKETARILGFTSPSRLTMWAMRKTPKLPYIRIGKFVRYLEEDILKFIEENRVNHEEPPT